MPLRFRIDEELGIVFTSAEGRVSREDLMQHARDLSLIRDRPLCELVDFSEQAEITVPTDAVRNTATFLREEDQNQPGSRLAMVAKTDSIYGMLRLYQAHREHGNVDIRVFRDTDEAMRWLETGIAG